MAKKEFSCVNCDSHYDIKFKQTEVDGEVKYCPFCGDLVSADESIDYEDND